jgi:hypothetical protein
LVRRRCLPGNGRGNTLSLIHLIELEDADGQCVHSEAIALRIATMPANISLRADTIRDLGSMFDRQGARAPVAPLQEAVRRAIDGLAPRLTAMRAQFHHRRQLMSAARSAAQALVQPRLFGRRPDDRTTQPLAVFGFSDARLTARVSLLAIIAILDR